MPGRNPLLVTGETYHVFNKGIDGKTTFLDKREFERATKVINFYRHTSPTVKLSRFLKLEEKEQNSIFDRLESDEKLIEIFCYCLMPNHFHFLIRQLQDGGISRFISQYLNSYTRYFNTRHDRLGPLFLDQFKAVRIETEFQLIHVSRYVHINPLTSFIVKSFRDLEKYQWSSLREYFSSEEHFMCNREPVLSFFGGNYKKYREFLFDQTDYQRRLKQIEHLAVE